MSILGKPLLQLSLIAIASSVTASPSSAAKTPDRLVPSQTHTAPEADHSIPGPTDTTKGGQALPNVVLILLDDIGFADTSTFGGVAQTPELDKLAAHGLRYINFNTAAVCSATRAALLSGRNHHRVGFGVVSEFAGDLPGYSSKWPKAAASLPEILYRNGYSTAAFGKWHNTPESEISPVGPFEHWPTRMGFEHFYGFLNGAENQWEPSALYRDLTPVEPPATPQQGYQLTTDLTDQAIDWLHTHESLAPGKPYFLYFATGAVHLPHHAPKEWIDRYRGRFDRGWDVLIEEVLTRQKQLGVVPADTALTPRPKEIPAWNTLSADQKKVYARQMEVYAGFIAFTDHEVGRLIRAVEQTAGASNTLILYVVGDNGATGEGGLNGYATGGATVTEQLQRIDMLGSYLIPINVYSAGWAWLGGTPFQWWKAIASHFGGVRDPLVVSWPAHIKDVGKVRRQFTYVTDIAATIFDAAGVTFPRELDGITQYPLDGVSFLTTFDHAITPSKHRTQYFEMLGNRAIYHDGWVAAAHHFTWGFQYKVDLDFSRDRWELYNVNSDFSEAHDLAAKYPAKLKELRALFDSEARNNNVYPLGGTLREGSLAIHETPIETRRNFLYYPGLPRLQRQAMPALLGKSFRIVADAVIPPNGAHGVLVAYGDRMNGFVLHLEQERLYYEANHYDGTHEVIVSRDTLPTGSVELTFEFTRDGQSGPQAPVGTGRLLVNGSLVGQSRLRGLEFGYYESMGIGEIFGGVANTRLKPPAEFNGILKQVAVELR